MTHRSAALERYASALGRLLPRLLQDQEPRIGPLVCDIADAFGFPAAKLVAFEREHQNRTTFVVAPTMLIEAVAAAVLLVVVPPGLGRVLPAAGMALLAVIWLSTFLRGLVRRSVGALDPFAGRVTVCQPTGKEAMSTAFTFGLGLVVTAITAAAVILVGVSEAADPSHSRPEDLAG